MSIVLPIPFDNGGAINKTVIQWWNKTIKPIVYLFYTIGSAARYHNDFNSLVKYIFYGTYIPAVLTAPTILPSVDHLSRVITKNMPPTKPVSYITIGNVYKRSDVLRVKYYGF
jgi:hypothetical protein